MCTTPCVPGLTGLRASASGIGLTGHAYHAMRARPHTGLWASASGIGLTAMCTTPCVPGLNIEAARRPRGATSMLSGVAYTSPGSHGLRNLIRVSTRCRRAFSRRHAPGDLWHHTIEPVPGLIPAAGPLGPAATNHLESRPRTASGAPGPLGATANPTRCVRPGASASTL